MLYLCIAGFTQFGLILLGALVTLNASWAEKYKVRALAAFAILGLIGVGATVKIGLDADSSNEKLANSLERLSAITLEMARVQTLNDSLLQGSLSPANDLTPSHRCGAIQDNDLLLFLGSNTVLVDKFPFAVVEAEGYEGIILNKDKNGTIAVSFEVLDSDGKIIAGIENGKFQVSKNIGLPPKRKDSSSLEVTDQFGKKVLSMRYLNKNALSIEAILYYPKISNYPLVISQSQGWQFGKSNNILHANCMKNSPLVLMARP